MPLLVVSPPLAGAEGVLPAQAHLFERRGFGLGADQLGIARAVAFAEGVAAGDQRHGFLVVHRHAAESFADVAAGGEHASGWPLGPSGFT
jgi:hypothetical protein